MFEDSDKNLHLYLKPNFYLLHIQFQDPYLNIS